MIFGPGQLHCRAYRRQCTLSLVSRIAISRIEESSVPGSSLNSFEQVRQQLSCTSRVTSFSFRPVLFVRPCPAFPACCPRFFFGASSSTAPAPAGSLPRSASELCPNTSFLSHASCFSALSSLTVSATICLSRSRIIPTAFEYRALNSSRSASTFLTSFSKFVTFFSVRPRRSLIWASVRSSAYSLLPCLGCFSARDFVFST
jgi:hypothetical protein